MATYRLDIAYDGTAFRGYALNRGVRTVQGELEGALGRIIGEPVSSAVAGRTDAGVHARGQVVSFTTGRDLDLARVARGLNSMLGAEIAVTAMTRADDEFHARFSATWRSYRYRVREATAPDPFTRRYAWHVGEVLDVGLMNTAAERFIGEHDFTSFCRSVEGRSNVRRVEEVEWTRDADEAVMAIRASAFCHQMVRSIVALMVDVGRGRTAVDSVGDIIEAKDRHAARGVAPPHGLTLWKVGY